MSARSSRGVASTSDLRARSRIDPLDRNPYDPCWHWLGALSTDGVPRIWTVDLDSGDKTALSGPKAVHYIATGKPLQGRLAFRKCGSRDCVNPGHHSTAACRAEIGAFVAAAGWRKGTHVEKRRANVRKAWAAQNTKVTPPEIVLAIRQAPEIVSCRELAALFGLNPKLASAIRRGKTRQGVVA